AIVAAPEQFAVASKQRGADGDAAFGGPKAGLVDGDLQRRVVEVGVVLPWCGRGAHVCRGRNGCAPRKVESWARGVWTGSVAVARTMVVRVRAMASLSFSSLASRWSRSAVVRQRTLSR